MHLQKLSKDLDAMVKSGESLDALKHHAQALVETDLIPDYKEFRRQIEMYTLEHCTGYWMQPESNSD